MVDFKDLQASWDDSSDVDHELLDAVADQVVRNHGKVKSILDCRDRSEVFTAAVVAIVFAFFAWNFSDNFYVWLGSLIVVGACFEVSAVLIWGRRGIQVKPDQLSVREFTLHQRTLVRRQIGLLRNVAWWYLLPFFVGLMVMVFGFGDRNIAIIFTVVVLVMYWWIWKMNQDAIVNELQPLHDDYTLTLESLEQPDKDFLSRSRQAITKSDRQSNSKLYQFAAFLGIMLVLLPVFSLIKDARHSYEKLSPFSAVRWQDGRPEVQVGDTWYELVKIDDTSATEIVNFCRYRYLGLSRKRFEEDLVEALTRMGHPPQRTSTLTVKTLSTDETLVLEDIQWTRENRNAIKRRNNATP